MTRVTNWFDDFNTARTAKKNRKHLDHRIAKVVRGLLSSYYVGTERQIEGLRHSGLYRSVDLMKG